MICPGDCVLLSERKLKQGCSRYASFFTAPRVPPAHLPAQAWEQGAGNKEQRANGSQPPDMNRCPMPGLEEQMARAARIQLEFLAQLGECALGGMAPHVAGRDGAAGIRVVRAHGIHTGAARVTATPLACFVGPWRHSWVKGQNVCLARRVAGVRFGLFECRLSGCSRCR